ncbi:unnamed protein product [Protopolystoma xenopodis]|uniref:Uncharacterized protein n=1 Tax=Protopolystoma xenopodis TaxID=117903 RepID=A0A448XK23_9PLAT|nr:unnamed protein product [Protopolystoma xenopodis]
MLPAKRLEMYQVNGPMMEVTNIMAEEAGLDAFHKVFLTLRPSCRNKVEPTLDCSKLSWPTERWPVYCDCAVGLYQGGYEFGQ